MSKRLGGTLAFALGAACLLGAAGGTAGATTPCTYVAAPSGSDSNPGTVLAPFQTAQKLVSTLQAGQTGCLRGGTYNQDVTFRTGGTATAPITLRSYPAESATIVGRMYVAAGADYTTITGLHLDGTNAQDLPSPTIGANHVTFSYDDVTNNHHTGVCFGVGAGSYGWATGTLITHNRVHDCGQLPATNLQHGFYIGSASDTTVEWNLIYANADRGIQLYPDGESTTIDHNIIDDNGEGILIAGDDGAASSYNNVYDNVVSDSNQRDDVQSWWPAGNPVGVGNSVHDNCVWGGREGTIDTSGGGYTATNNLAVNPEFADAAAHDYEMSADSPCLALVGDVQAAVDGTTATLPSHPGPTPARTGSAVSPSATATPTTSRPTAPGSPAPRKGVPAAHPKRKLKSATRKVKHATRKAARHRGRLRPRRRPVASRRSYPSLRRLP